MSQPTPAAPIDLDDADLAGVFGGTGGVPMIGPASPLEIATFIPLSPTVPALPGFNPEMAERIQQAMANLAANPYGGGEP